MLGKALSLSRQVEGPNRTPEAPATTGARAFTTVVTYGVVNVGNLDTQPGNALHRTQRTSVNLVWNPVPFVDIVVEVLAGTRVNKDGEHGSASQIQSGWTLKF